MRPLTVKNSFLYPYIGILGWATWTEAHSEPCQVSKMEYFVKIVKSWKSLTMFAKSFISDIRQGFKYSSVTHSSVMPNPYLQISICDAKREKHPWRSVTVTLLHECYSRFLYCTNDTKLHKASQMVREIFLVSEIP